MFIKVKILNLNAVSKLILKIVSSEQISISDKINMITEKKYLFISDWSM